jgi:hypothetical protein
MGWFLSYVPFFSDHILDMCKIWAYRTVDVPRVSTLQYTRLATTVRQLIDVAIHNSTQKGRPTK